MSMTVCTQCFSKAESFISMNCFHSFCHKCIVQIIFTDYVNELHLWGKLTVKCTENDKGYCSLQMNEILQILQKSIQTSTKDTSCIIHCSQNRDLYCKDCNYYICGKCSKDNEHYDHIKLDTNEIDKYAKEIIELMNYLPLTNKSFDAFADHFQQIGETYRKTLEDEFNKTIRTIDELMNELKSFKLVYAKTIKEKAEKSLLIMKILKLLYFSFYNDFENISELDIMTLLNMKNIKNEFKDIKIDVTLNENINNTLNELKLKVKELAKIDKNTNLIKSNYIFQEVSNEFMKTNTLIGHTKNVNKIIQLANGDLCTCSEDYSIRFWKESPEGDFDSTVLDKLIGRVKDIIQIDDGRILFSQFSKNTVRVLDDFESKGTYICNQEIVGHNDYITSIIQISNQRIVTASKDKKIMIWKMNNMSFEQENVLDHYVSGVYSICYTNDNKLVSGGDQGEIIVWIENKDTKQFCKENAISAHSLRVTTLHPLKSEEIASGSYDGNIIIWKKTENEYVYECIFKLEAHELGVSSIIQIYDGRLLSGGYDKFIRVWYQTKKGWESKEKLADMNEQVLSVYQLKDNRIAGTGLTRAVIWKSRYLLNKE